ncbi:MAG: ubiquinol-cytochrome c reductase iron-sulfur subunit, partial [Pseudonocardiaceae bacterium]
SRLGRTTPAEHSTHLTTLHRSQQHNEQQEPANLKIKPAITSVDGTLHVVSLRCTHLGCLLRFNGAERSWDCPCHGSRFDVDGAVLEGPALHPLPRPQLTDPS